MVLAGTVQDQFSVLCSSVVSRQFSVFSFQLSVESSFNSSAASWNGVRSETGQTPSLRWFCQCPQCFLLTLGPLVRSGWLWQLPSRFALPCLRLSCGEFRGRELGLAELLVSRCLRTLAQERSPPWAHSLRRLGRALAWGIAASRNWEWRNGARGEVRVKFWRTLR